MIRNLLISSSLFYLLTSALQAQDKYDYIWLFGYGSNTQDSTFGGTDINFNNNPATLDYVFREPDIGTNNASICDAEGNLLFYTNGCFIADASHQIMMNGDTINPGIVYDEWCDNSTYPTVQDCFILPKPGSDSLYYLFHKAVEIVSVPFLIYNNKIYYSLVDMSLNNGLGAVIEKNVLLLEDSLTASQFTAIKHANNLDWWIICPKYNTGKYWTFLLTNSSIEGPYLQHIGEATTNGGGGQGVFSPDGNRFVIYTPTDGAFIFDFDRQTGLLSNFIKVFPQGDGIFGGAAISANSRYLYLTRWNKVFQYDMEASSIANSEIIVAEYDGFMAEFQTNFFQAQLGPDCRIYINSTNGNYVLHVIKYPDEPGLACEVIQHGIHLPTRHYASLPNFPHYRLGTGAAPCDPDIDIPITIDSIPVNTTLLPELVYEFSIYPNPAKDRIELSYQLLVEGDAELVILNEVGQLVWTAPLSNGTGSKEINLDKYPAGIYFMSIQQNGGVIHVEKFVVIK
jgi:Secretion system C-terminal sorting domain